MKVKTDIVFSVVIYRNTDDLAEFLESVKQNVKPDYRVILVNNYYDGESRDRAKKIAGENGCDFIDSKNNGYGSGNNRAVEYALEHYDFEYFIVSNPDIVIKKFDCKELSKIKDGVLAPEIITVNGKRQNPMYVRDLRTANKRIYRGLKNNKKFPFYFGIGQNKIVRGWHNAFYKLSRKTTHKIYQAHGSFVIFTNSCLQQTGAPYDENMFLFAEESYLAHKLKEKNIPTRYCSFISVVHKEDGSMKFRSDISDQLKKSNLYFYENYYFKP
ncbi:MAG: glycosyltransferase [Clostridia bacterium]|nr:glycosyltransferase [Clostridia bacterium]